MWLSKRQQNTKYKNHHHWGQRREGLFSKCDTWWHPDVWGLQSIQAFSWDKEHWHLTTLNTLSIRPLWHWRSPWWVELSSRSAFSPMLVNSTVQLVKCSWSPICQRERQNLGTINLQKDNKETLGQNEEASTDSTPHRHKWLYQFSNRKK